MENIQEPLLVDEKDETQYLTWPIHWIMHLATKSESKSLPPENMMSPNNSSIDNTSIINGLLTKMINNGREGDGEQPSEQCTDLLESFLTYYLPTVILFGLIGNILSCIVFLSTHLKMRSSSYYLAALSTADFGFLLSISFVWLNNNFGIQVYNTNGWCQGLVYLSSVCSFLSVWLIVSFTVERFIAVQYPLHRPRMCTVHRAKTVVSVLTGIAVVFNTYSFFTVGMKINEQGEVCEMREGYDEAMRIISIIDSILTLILPLVLIIIMNTMIMKNLLQFGENLERSSSFSRNDRKNQFPLQWFTKPNQNTETIETPIGSPSEETIPAERRTDSISRALRMSSVRNSVTTRTQQNITKMLLLISTVFVLLNLPSYIMRLYSLWHQKTPMSLWCVQQMSVLLYYTNFSINFLLYSMYGITFRKCLRQLVQNKYSSIVESVCPHSY
ncbi:thyrotropin-releasing hormone receptor [Halyomorpha halys]|uniref:thyrotropin-releasing hormone receptor n=1 Tax=Halyomorpha halys TaxID=286706 RepID=UPI0006D527B2|nr:pyrokinin-1 receptor-like [Halyomorpha halys]